MPVGLFGYFEKHEIRVTNPYHGIYYVLDAVLFPIQIVVTKELDKKEYTWLTALSEGMEKQDMKALLERIDGDLGADDDRIKELLKKRYGFSDEEAEEYL